MNVLIACAGSAGDVHPFMAIGQALRQRGHHVTLFASPYFQDRILRAGLRFVPIGDLADYEAIVGNPDLWHPRRGFPLIWAAMQQQLEACYHALTAHLGPDTILIGSTLAWPARLVQETHRVPLATIHLSPANFLSAMAPPALPGLAWLASMPAWFRRVAMAAVSRLVLDRMIKPDFNALRARLGLPPASNVMGSWMHSPDCVIGAFPDWFAPVQADWPANTSCTHFTMLAAPPGAVLDPLLARFIQAGPAPIAFTPGSAMAHGRAFFERAIEASHALGRRAILITPWREQLPDPLPKHVRHVSYVPFDLLMPKVAAFVHHGGIGTLAQCLAAGVPQLLVPFAHDQFDNARRISRLGAGLTVSTRDSKAIWAERLMTLLESREIQHACADLAARMPREPVSEVLLARLEAMASPQAR
ncbi:glycosyltransferase [Chitinimonas sp. BJYL2]|uniref:glycosyltransferase n=1 Tax=Chitinimonas sp. BJYL2 TaxID=2976696 RepID=UPI0022B36A97|nr:glycosyltransferase [Chitinimonas sp. BJYL2]